MMDNEHNEFMQSGGDNVVQTQGAAIVNYTNNFYVKHEYPNALTKDEVTQVVKEMLCDMETNLICKFREEYKNNAYKLNGILIPKMEKGDVLGAFGDPGFLSVLFQAYRTAFLIQEKDAFEVLSELLLNRAAHPKIDNKKIAIEKAVSIINNVSDASLKGLAAYYCLLSIIPVRGDVYKSLEVYANMFDQLGIEGLPVGRDWLDELDILGAIRTYDMGMVMKSFDDFMAGIFPGFLVRGIEQGGDSFCDVSRLLREADIPENILIPHEFHPHYMRLPVVGDYFDTLEQVVIPNANGSFRTLDLDSSKRKVLRQVYKNISGNDGISKDDFDKMKKQLTDAIDQYEPLRKIKAWWSQVNTAFSINEVGLAIGYSYAKNKVAELPERM